jgi:hypothetical protein
MKLNRSMAISSKIQECKMGNIIGLLEHEFPSAVLRDHAENLQSRNRVFTLDNTLLTMVLTSIQKDKTLKNSVDLFYMIHQQYKQQTLNELKLHVQKKKEEDQLDTERKAGRPKKYNVKLPKSLENDISLNTAAYSKARERIPIKLVQELFNASRMH